MTRAPAPSMAPHARRLLCVVVVLLVAACKTPLPARKPTAQARPAAAAGPFARDITTPGGISLTMACTPTGSEMCFDATDNNCNGVLDEGCGVHTGPLQFAAAWEEGPDVDLDVTDPAGELA